MSGVFERNRALSTFEFFSSAIELRAEATRVAMSDAIPKRWRFTFAEPMAATARDVVANVVTADAFYPNTPENVVARKRHLTLAIAACEMLCQDLQCAMALGLPVKASRLEGLLERVEHEVKLLKGARSGVKLIGKGVE